MEKLLNIIYLIAKKVFYGKINIYKVYKSVLGRQLLKTKKRLKKINIYKFKVNGVDVL